MKHFLQICLIVILIAFLNACGGGSSDSNQSNGNNNGGGDGGPSGPPLPASNAPFWTQWGANPQHSGAVPVAGQGAIHQLADIVYDPFVLAERRESGGGLIAHYPSPILDGNDVYFTVKTGTYTACSSPTNWTNGETCGPNAWHTMVWNEARDTWVNGALVRQWTFTSDWKPPTNGASLFGWEPVFHPVDANDFLYVPGAGGTVWKVNKTSGQSAAHINPFSAVTIDAPNTFVAGPLSADAHGNIYYNVIELANRSLGDPWTRDAINAWLVKITPADATSTVTYSALLPRAPAADGLCPGRFTSANPLPWPPTTTAVPASVTCGSQRPGINVAPAIASDGTIYTVSRAHLDQRVGYIVAVNPDLTVKWTASLQTRLHDGCGDIVPIAPANNPNQPNSCRNGTTPGVDPTTNDFGSGNVADQSSSSPTVLPDGSVLYGATTNFNGARGHLFKFDSQGNFQSAYSFGWDSTPGVWQHDGTYSIVIKDNHYETGLYCNFNNPICQLLPDGPYYITQLDPNMNVEWKFLSTNTQSCHRNPDGSLSCVSDHPNGFEWCINMPAVDSNGNVYANSEDGNLYVIPQGHSGIFSAASSVRFLNLALGAAYTPLSIGPDGKLYTQNAGHLFVVGT